MRVDFPRISISGPYWRLIPSKYPTVDVYDRLGPPALQEAAIRLEELTNPRLLAKARITGGPTAPDANSPKLHSWNAAAFAYPMPEGSYFLPPPYAVLELVSTESGALARAVLRRQEFLARTDEPPCGLDMRVLSYRVVGAFADLRGLAADLSEVERRSIGKRLYEEGALGVVFKMASIADAECVSVFTADALPDKALQCDHYRFSWSGAAITRVYNFREGRDLSLDEIFATRQVAA